MTVQIEIYSKNRARLLCKITAYLMKLDQSEKDVHSRQDLARAEALDTRVHFVKSFSQACTFSSRWQIFNLSQNLIFFELSWAENI